MTKTRVLAALIMAPVAIAAILLLPTQWLAAAAAAVLLIGLWEWLKLAGIEDTLARTVLLVLNLLLMVLLVWADGSTLVLFQITTLAGVAWWLAALVWLRFFNFGAQPSAPSRIVKMLAGTLAIVPAWAALVLIHAGGDPPGKQGHLWLLAALALVWAADSGAYFAGRHFGKHKLAPRISPNKTWEGLFGGLLAGIDTAHLPGLLITSVVAVFASVLGDLFESLIKRHAGAKDSGHLIPGHGGVLDRVDGVLAAVPVFALGKEIFGF
jgi:phosphatidate cytidylyltransferase